MSIPLKTIPSPSDALFWRTDPIEPAGGTGPADAPLDPDWQATTPGLMEQIRANREARHAADLTLVEIAWIAVSFGLLMLAGVSLQ